MLALLLAGCAAAPPCGLPDGREMLRAELLFGRDGVGDAAWDAFVREDLTAAFPEGLTILAARGQWREPSQLVLVLLGAQAQRSGSRQQRTSTSESTTSVPSPWPQSGLRAL